jgi:hypothetical protein
MAAKKAAEAELSRAMASCVVTEGAVAACGMAGLAALKQAISLQAEAHLRKDRTALIILQWHIFCF